ncbi:oxidoreductase [Klebsiella pneumoniae subsp. ozaenae]|uniref:Oxidoreductase n=1 Tax=Klebsiella pneumoniae subsp. ozaenae TaxID=574 RepID=A0A378ANT3_KLEPO|nr:oxidoreductase [Klebsiella pneumoniae subsp. ozaenae]
METLTAWRVQPNGTEGYRTAEVTLGGVDTNELSSRTMEARKAPGLYFIGEVMDVTGWLGGITSSGRGQAPGPACRRWWKGNLRVRAPWCPDVYDQFNPRKYWAI